MIDKSKMDPMAVRDKALEEKRELEHIKNMQNTHRAKKHKELRKMVQLLYVANPLFRVEDVDDFTIMIRCEKTRAAMHVRTGYPNTAFPPNLFSCRRTSSNEYGQNDYLEETLEAVANYFGTGLADLDLD